MEATRTAAIPTTGFVDLVLTNNGRAARRSATLRSAAIAEVDQQNVTTLDADRKVAQRAVACSSRRRIGGLHRNRGDGRSNGREQPALHQLPTR